MPFYFWQSKSPVDWFAQSWWMTCPTLHSALTAEQSPSLLSMCSIHTHTKVHHVYTTFWHKGIFKSELAVCAGQAPRAYGEEKKILEISLSALISSFLSKLPRSSLKYLFILSALGSVPLSFPQAKSRGTWGKKGRGNESKTTLLSQHLLDLVITPCSCNYF